MNRSSLAHLSDDALLRDLVSAIGRERTAMADVLAHIAEVDARRLYLPAGYPSMFLYCVHELHLSEDAAFKRIQAARAARRFPAILDAVVEGRLHLTGVGLLVPHLTEDTAAELLAAAGHKTKAEIETLLAERIPKSDLLAWATATPSSEPDRSACQLAPAQVELSPGKVERVHDAAKVTPLSTASYGVQFTLSERVHKKLRYAQTLLGHRVASGDIAQVFEQALDALIPQLEKRRFAATKSPSRGHGRRPSANSRHVPAHVRRAIWHRDGGQCTFVSENGHRCAAREDLEYDHVLEVSRGGEATVDGIRLLCRAHNQYAAERTFGPEFMRHKRIAAAELRAAAKERAAAAAKHESSSDESDDQDVVPWLRALGFSTAEARRAAERCRDIPDASLEERVRVALTCFRVRGSRVVSPG